MTCNAPYDAKIYITETGGYISPLTWTKNKCGHNDDPPDYDYIPQPLRWISEWSETYCLAQKDLLESMKNCENCKKKNDNTDCEQTKYGACRDCKKKCEQYSQFVEKWKAQFEIQDETYKEIYERATRKGGNGKGIDANTKKFVEKLEENCKKEDFSTADKYLENGSVCRRFKFVKTDTHEKNYAFHNTPPRYKENCKCAKDFDPLDECPVDTDGCSYYKKYSCVEKYFNQKSFRWTNDFVKKHISNNNLVMVPPRRRKLCLSSVSNDARSITTEETLKQYIFHCASSEANYLWKKHKNDPKKALTAMKYSFADYGDIVKGTDMLDNINILHGKINKIFRANSNSSVYDSSKKWWEKK